MYGVVLGPKLGVIILNMQYTCTEDFSLNVSL